MRNDNGIFDIIEFTKRWVFTMLCLISYMMHFYNSTYPMQFVYECLRVKLLSILITITHAIAYTNAISKVQLGPTTILKYSLGLDVGYTEPVFFIYVYTLI